jgi:hypothetical protein
MTTEESIEAMRPATLEEIRLMFVALSHKVCNHFSDGDCPRCQGIEKIEALQEKMGKDALPLTPRQYAERKKEEG